MAYNQPPKPVVEWDRPGLFQGVTIKRQLEDGKWYAWRIPYNGVVTRAVAAELLAVTVMTISNWVESGALREVRHHPSGTSLMPLSEIKKVRKVMDDYGRLRRGALG